MTLDPDGGGVTGHCGSRGSHISLGRKEALGLHLSQNLPVKPSTHWHCCQDQRSKQVPPCLQGLAVQAPSSLGHLQTGKTDSQTVRRRSGRGQREGRGGLFFQRSKQRKNI